jgi:apolipoprotein D and lipocalin family protein
MKKDKWLIALAAGAGVAAVIYSLLNKKDIADNTTLVQPFDKDRYLGKWYEIARLPSRIEKNIKDLTEEYLLNNDGSIKVITRGYNVKSDKWKTFEGRMKFAGSEDVGRLEVSYFGPFYLAYNVLNIDADYNYALVSGSGLGYLWILSRGKTIPAKLRKQFLHTARVIGFETDKLEWV